jgi:tetratricopeptide (TPR) repeat protein
MKEQRKNRGQSDQSFDVALEDYINHVVTAEKEDYKPGLRPFSAYEAEIRSKLHEVFNFFSAAIANGYRVLIEELKDEMKTSESKEDLLALAAVNPEKLNIFDDNDALVKAFEEGTDIYELLGFTEKSLNVFYHAVRRMIEDKAFKNARDACYFLVTIAPWVPQFWVSLGRCDIGLGAYDVAFQEFVQAIDIDPTDSTAYQELVDLLIETHEFNKATSVCNAGLQMASEHKQEPWAAPLRARLDGMLNDIQIAVRKVK